MHTDSFGHSLHFQNQIYKLNIVFSNLVIENENFIFDIDSFLNVTYSDRVKKKKQYEKKKHGNWTYC